MVTEPVSPTVAVNARFRQRPVTGVERVAGELLARLPDALGRVARADLVELAPQRPGHGVRGHAWEQLQLPQEFRRSRAQVLLSLCNLGPVRVREQVVLIHDVAPFRLPAAFTTAYGAQVRAVQRMLARRCTIATVSEHSRRELATVLSLDPQRIAIVPPAVGPGFRAGSRAGHGGYCLFVGGHDHRKNLEFLLRLWPQVVERTGLELHVVSRSSTGTLRGGAPNAGVAGVRRHLDPDDDGLAAH